MTAKKFIFSTKYQLIILLILAVGVNINTLFNQYAVDDVVVMTENTLVEKGIKGIPEILSTELFYGFDKTGGGLSEARYRPFSLVIFALEYQFFGANPMVSHLINILFFILLIALLYKLLQAYLFREQNKNLAFITCLLFAVHPIHTEVIANVKSRDELIAFVLIIISTITLIKHSEKRSIAMLFIGLLSFFLALLTRESAVTFIGVFPLLLYFFFNRTLKKVVLFSLPLIAVFIGYLTLRIAVVGFSHSTNTDILNSPFLYATASEAFATKVFILFKYLWLLILPHPLSCDYGFNQIPYIGITSIQFILSLLLYLGLITYAVFTFKKKSIFSFCILYFMLTISLVANFIVDIGTPLSERLLFQPSLAFCIVLAIFYLKAEQRSKVLANTTIVVVLVLFSIKTFTRNFDWKNDETLYFADATNAPNSARTNLYAAERYIQKANVETNRKLKNEYLKNAIYYGERSLKIYPNYFITYLNLGDAYFFLLDYFKAADLWIKAYNLNPSSPDTIECTERLSSILFEEGNKFYEKGNIGDAIRCYLKSVELNSKNVEAWYNLGGTYFLINDTKDAIAAWRNVLNLSPNHQLDKEQFHLN